MPHTHKTRVAMLLTLATVGKRERAYIKQTHVSRSAQMTICLLYGNVFATVTANRVPTAYAMSCSCLFSDCKMSAGLAV